jgi:hypothetical protein
MLCGFGNRTGKGGPQNEDPGIIRVRVKRYSVVAFQRASTESVMWSMSCAFGMPKTLPGIAFGITMFRGCVLGQLGSVTAHAVGMSSAALPRLRSWPSSLAQNVTRNRALQPLNGALVCR